MDPAATKARELEARMDATIKTTTQIRLTRPTAAYWRVTFDNPPLNVMGPQLVRELREITTTIESDKEVKVIVFDSAVEGFFLNHSDFFFHHAGTGRAGGPNPQRKSYASYASFSDPDGNGWACQEITARLTGHIEEGDESFTPELTGVVRRAEAAQHVLMERAIRLATSA
ncbi:MAG TPA: hypothetical protein VF901_11255 [Bradyrhizobium sp.]